MNTFDRMQAIIDAATPGPWHHDTESEWGHIGDVTIWGDGEVVASDIGTGEVDSGGSLRKVIERALEV